MSADMGGALFFVCSRCGSSNVRSDASAEWDARAQEWVLDGTLDEMHCKGACADATSCVAIDPQDFVPVATHPRDFDNTEALSEGWMLIQDGSGGFVIERDDEECQFGDDDEAIEYVADMANDGSAYHLTALMFHACSEDAP